MKRADYMSAMQDINPDDIIVLDESGSNLGMTSDYARAEGGSRAKAPKPHDCGTKFSILGAISTTGIVAASYVESAVNTEIFETFISKLLTPELDASKYVVMDNVGFHKSSSVIEQIEKTGAKVVFLPPYSPDLSPIEKLWSKVKDFLKRKKARTKPDFHDALALALDEITEDDLHGWYAECGYNIR